MRTHTARWPAGQLTTSELANERAELERKISDSAFASAASRDIWQERLTSIIREQRSRAEAEQQSRAALAES